MTGLLSKIKHLQAFYRITVSLFPHVWPIHSLQIHKGPITKFTQARRSMPLEIISLGQPSFLGSHAACFGPVETEESSEDGPCLPGSPCGDGHTHYCTLVISTFALSYRSESICRSQPKSTRIEVPTRADRDIRRLALSL